MDTPTILAYGFDARDAKALRSVCDRLGLRLRKVLPEEYDRSVGSFVGRGRSQSTDASGDPLPEPMLVLCHVTERQLEAFLSGLRTARVGQTALKAVLTDTNARWSGRQLCGELQAERKTVDG